MRLQDHAAESLSFKSMLGGAITGAIGFLASINWIGLIGVLVAVLGLFANIHFQLRRDKREQRESEARIQAMENRAPCRKTDFPGSNFDGWGK